MSEVTTIGPSVIAVIENIIKNQYMSVLLLEQRRTLDLATKVDSWLAGLDRRVTEMERRFGTEPREALAKDIDRLEQRLNVLRAGVDE